MKVLQYAAASQEARTINTGFLFNFEDVNIAGKMVCDKPFILQFEKDDEEIKSMIEYCCIYKSRKLDYLRIDDLIIQEGIINNINHDENTVTITSTKWKM